MATATLAYSVIFAAALRDSARTADLLRALVLLIAGLVSIPVFVALYGRLCDVDHGFGLVALLLGVTAAIGSSVHGAFDVSTFIEQPKEGVFDVASEADPRGFLTFGVMALAIATFGWLIGQGDALPRGTGRLAYVLGVSMLVIFVSGLVADVDSPATLASSFLVGFVAYPSWFLWIGTSLRRTDASTSRLDSGAAADPP